MNFANPSRRRPHPRLPGPALLLGLALALGGISCDFLAPRRLELALPADAPAFTNYHVAAGPWSVHVARWPRHLPHLELRAVHAEDHALGLAVLSDVLKRLPRAQGRPVAALNADFFQRDRAFAGDPRGIQISAGNLVSAPRRDSTAFWLDATGQPHLEVVEPRFTVTWPDGSETPFGLNEERAPTAAVLYTPALGDPSASLEPGTAGPPGGGLELILEPDGEGPWPQLPIGQSRSARIRDVRPAGPTPTITNTLVLSLGPALRPGPPKLAPGDRIRLSTATSPDLRGASLAIAGGPALVHRGRVQETGDPEAEDYQTATMLERHPRSAFGWNADHFFLVQVDGRHKDVSVGMTLDELARELVRLGCDEALNFDGGGSSALWFDGRIRNRPCDGFERSIANALVLVDTRPSPPAR